MKHYKLSCDDAEVTLVSDKDIDLQAAARQALRGMSYDAVVTPSDDWFEAIVDGVCELTGATRVDPAGTLNVESLYFDEVRKREDDGPPGSDE